MVSVCYIVVLMFVLCVCVASVIGFWLVRDMVVVVWGSHGMCVVFGLGDGLLC